jgi:CheY-like chemotaxis protein
VRRRVLVVDDNADAAHGLAEVLRARGHEVEVALDAAQALDAAARFAFQVALVDIGLPAMDGYELAGHLRALRPARLVAVTGYGQQQDRDRSHLAGFVEHLTKPVPVERILEVVERGEDA